MTGVAQPPIYYIDYSAVESGKRLAASKRRVRFRFGFANNEALAQGLRGTDCRGQEHEVTLVWSLTSGKRLVLADGHEVHFSKGSMQQTKFDTTWTMRGQHTVKLVAYAAPPLFDKPGFRQFELFLDGMSIFSMPKIYELGTSSSRTSNRSALVPHALPSSTTASAYNNYSLPPQYDEARYNDNLYQHERRRQLHDRTPREEQQPEFARPPTAESESMPVDLMSDPTPVHGMQDHLAAPVALLDQQTATPTTATQSSHDEFAPVAPPPPTLANIHTEILGAYVPQEQKPALPALAAESHTHGGVVPLVTPTSTNAPPQSFAYGNTTLVSPVSDITTTPPSQHYQTSPPPPPQQQAAAPSQYHPQQAQYQQPPPQQYYYQKPPVVYQEPAPQYQEPVAPPAPEEQQPVLTMMEYSKDPAQEAALLEADPHKMENALRNLVNLDDITQDPDTPEKMKLTMLKQEEAKRQAKLKSTPMPPKVGAWHLGPQPSLDEVQETAPPRAAPLREVMKIHAFDPAAAQAGMMVLYGTTTPHPQHQPFHYSHSSIGGMGFGYAGRAY